MNLPPSTSPALNVVDVADSATAPPDLAQLRAMVAQVQGRADSGRRGAGLTSDAGATHAEPTAPDSSATDLSTTDSPAADPPRAGPAEEERARAAVLRQLTGSAKTRAQLAGMLQQRGISDEIATVVLDRMTEVGLINDAEFAHTWVKSRSTSKGLTRSVLTRELRTKGVAETDIATAVSQLDDSSEQAKARELAVARHRLLGKHPYPVKLRRLVAYLQRKGYPLSVAVETAREVLEPEGDHDQTRNDHHGSDSTPYDG